MPDAANDQLCHSGPHDLASSHTHEIPIVPHDNDTASDVSRHYGSIQATTSANIRGGVSNSGPRDLASSHTHEIPIDPHDDDTASDVSRHYGPVQATTSASIRGGVDVRRAEADFAELKRELSHHSRISRQASQHQEQRSGIDIEKGGLAGHASVSPTTSDEEPFDLEATLRGNKNEDEKAGIKNKRIGVVWENLTVKGIGGTKNYVKTFPMAFVSFFNVYEIAKSILGQGKKGRQCEILKDFRGVAKPGEMVLVLGKPGSGCTTFLKVISNQRFGYTGVDGEVLYGPFDSQMFAKRYRGEAVYNGEDDIHHPTLTVGQTFDFALETKVPGKRPAGLSRHEFKEKVIELLLKMFNIEVSYICLSKTRSKHLLTISSTPGIPSSETLSFAASPAESGNALASPR